MWAFYTVIKASLALDTNVQEQIYRYMYKEIKLQYSSRINVHLDVSINSRKPEVSYQNLLMVKTFKKK